MLVQGVRRAQEHHPRQVVVEVEVVVVEGVWFCSGSSTSSSADGRVPAEVGRHLVDLVEQEDRVARAAGLASGPG